jgi:hypothetical protein
MAKRVQHEQGEQTALTQWFALQFPKEMLMHIPNQLIRGCVQARVMYMAGIIPGAPDLFLCCARGEYHGLWIELKRKSVRGEPRGRITKRQLLVMEHLSLKGYKCVVAFGFENARNAILDYMRK